MRQFHFQSVMIMLVGFALCGMFTTPVTAQTYTVLHTFVCTDGWNPTGLVQGLDGDFYGTNLYSDTGTSCATAQGGTFFKISPGGAYSVLRRFVNTPAGDGNPAFILQSPWGNFYGTTLATDNEFYRITPSGAETILAHFCSLTNCADGDSASSMIWDWNQDIRVTTTSGGVMNNGTVLRFTPKGAETVVHTFCELPNCLDGAQPASMIQASDGNFYGVTSTGGANTITIGTTTGGAGTVFVMGPHQPFKKIYDFCSQASCADGATPASLIQGPDGDLYGTTHNFGNIPGNYSYSGCCFGTIFKITTSGVLTTLYTFCSSYTEDCPGAFDSGYLTMGPLVVGSDGNFYGVNKRTSDKNDQGVIFQLTPSGSYSVLYLFSPPEGVFPTALFQGTDGAFYGANLIDGGKYLLGNLFRFDMGLAPFIQPVLTFGKVGATVTLLGTNLTGATAVSFNGTAATIGKVTSTRIETTVPEGATSGRIAVTTPSGVLTSNLPFTVVP